jgi:hypothetical protein
MDGSANGPRYHAGEFVTALPFLSEILRQPIYRVLREWIAQCDKDHSSCTLTRKTSLPKRVLQLSSDTIHVRDNMTLRAPYACLSHCWGKKGPDLKLTGQTMKDLKEGVPISHLPKTFEHAVRVCKSLQISFLWIDALCKLVPTRPGTSHIPIIAPQVSNRITYKTGERQQHKCQASMRTPL